MGSRGPLAHVDQWAELWDSWQLLRDSVTIQSHVGVQGNERADEGGFRGSTQAFQEVLRDREVGDIWHELGLEELNDVSDDDMSGGGGVSPTVSQQKVQMGKCSVRDHRSHRSHRSSLCASDSSPASEGGG